MRAVAVLRPLFPMRKGGVQPTHFRTIDGASGSGRRSAGHKARCAAKLAMRRQQPPVIDAAVRPLTHDDTQPVTRDDTTTDSRDAQRSANSRSAC
jgi:hypothetical protein